MFCVGTDLEHKDNLGGTPLMDASDSGHLNVVRILLARGKKYNLLQHQQLHNLS